MGRRVRRLGRARRLLRHRPGGDLRTGAAPGGGGPEALRRRLVPVRGALHQRTGQHGAPHRGRRASAGGPGRAGHARRRARPRAQQPRLGRDPCGRRAGGDLRCPAGLAAPPRRGRDHRGAVRAARPPPTGGGPPGGGWWTRWRRPTPRTRCPTGWSSGGSTGTGSSRPRWPRPGSTSVGADASSRCWDAKRSPRGWSGWRTPSWSAGCSPRSRTPPAGSPTSSRRCAPTPSSTGPRCRRPT